MENAAKVYILGAAAVIVSGVKLEDWKTVEKYAPDALKIADDNGEVIFRVRVCDDGGSVNEYGICWGSYTSDEGYATVTTLLDDDIVDKKAAVMDIAGSALLDLAEIEKQIPEVLEEIRAKKAEIGTRIVML